jgi:hypothetical protein
MSNKRNTIYGEAFGERKPLHEWAKDSRCVVTYRILHSRIFTLKWDLEKAMTTPARGWIANA